MKRLLLLLSLFLATPVFADQKVIGDFRVIGGGVGIGTNATSSYVTVTPNTTYFIIDGNIGIGSTAPSKPLDVNGAARIDGNVGIGTFTAPQKLYVAGTAEMQGFKMTGNGVGSGFRLTSNSVGIGTWMPDNNTDVNTSNVIYSWTGQTSAAGAVAMDSNTSLTPTTTPTDTFFYVVIETDINTPREALRSKFKKVAGVSTLTVFAYIWGESGTTICQLDVNGSTSNSNSVSSTSPTWTSAFTLDVSGLTNGTVYDLVINLIASANSVNAFLGSIIIFGS